MNLRSSKTTTMLLWTFGSSRTLCQRFISSTQIRNASILSKLRPIPGSQVNSTRLGRGPGNKKGKTSGRGTKGQNSRAGGGNAFFEGGQTPIHIRFPKIGHNNSRRLDMTPVNLDRIQAAIDAGLIDPNLPITMKTLKEARVVNKIEDGVKLLARGKETLAQPITIYVSRASRDAIQTIENTGGKVTTVYYNKLGIKYLLNPEKFGTTRRIPRAALPVRRYLIDYYSNPLKRGYLSSPAVDLSELGLAPPKTKPKAALPTVPISTLMTRSHAVLMEVAQKEKLRHEYREVKVKYQMETRMAEDWGYINGKKRIPKRLRIRH